jgi:hypothetical protein
LYSTRDGKKPLGLKPSWNGINQASLRGPRPDPSDLPEYVHIRGTWPCLTGYGKRVFIPSLDSTLRCFVFRFSSSSSPGLQIYISCDSTNHRHLRGVPSLPPSPTLVGAAPFRDSTKPEHTQHSMCNNERRGGRSNPTNSVSYCALSTSCKQVRVPVVGLGRVSLHVAPPNVSGPKIIARRYVLVFGTTVFGLAAPPTYTTPPKNPTFRYHVVCRIRSNNHIHFFRCWLVGRTCLVQQN